MRALSAASGSHAAVQMAYRPARPTATNVRANSAGQYVSLKKPSQNPRVAIHAPGVSM